MLVDIAAESDGRYELGSPNETCLNKMLTYIQSVKTTEGAEVKMVNSLNLQQRLYKGAVVYL